MAGWYGILEILNIAFFQTGHLYIFRYSTFTALLIIQAKVSDHEQGEIGLLKKTFSPFGQFSIKKNINHYQLLKIIIFNLNFSVLLAQLGNIFQYAEKLGLARFHGS